MQPWPSPTSAAWPAWCARTWRQKLNLPLLIGALPAARAPTRTAGPDLLAQTREGYGNLSELITLARSRAPGEYRLAPEDFTDPPPGCAPARPARMPGHPDARVRRRRRPRRRAGALAGARVPAPRLGRLTLLHRSREDLHRDATVAAAREAGLPLVALGQVQMHLRRASRTTRWPASAATSRCRAAATLAGNAERHCARACGWPAVPARGAGADAGGGAAAASRWTSCATSIRTRSCRRARPPPTCARRRRPAPRAAPGRARGDRHADRERAGPDPRPAIRGVFPDRLRHRPVRARPGHPARAARQLGRLLLPGHHRGRPDTRPRCSSASSARRNEPPDRRGLRAPAPRGSDPVHLRQVWPRPLR